MFILSINNSQKHEYFRTFHQRFEDGQVESEDVQILIESLRTRHFLKRKPLYQILSEVLKHLETLLDGGIQSNKTVQRKVQRLLVGAHLKAVFRHRETGRVKVIQNQGAISKKKFPKNSYQLIYIIAQVCHFWLNII